MLKQTITVLLLLAFFTPTLATADNCVYWQRQINKVSNWSRYGGNTRQIQDWQRQQNYLQGQLNKCRGTTPGPISVARGPAANTTNYTPATRVHSNIKDAELQQLIATCNRWIDIANSSNSFENQSIKDTACRAANNKEAQLNNPATTTELKLKRSIKECIKPNNIVDSDVKACMQGLKEPSWINKKIKIPNTTARKLGSNTQLW